MHRAIRAALNRGVSIISMGANQLYWVVRWNTEHTKMECRKDLTFFNHSISYGGMWKHHFKPQQKYLGGRYNGLGMHTFAPYRLIAHPNHWALAGLNVQEGELFGMTGIDGKPICGAETDKVTRKKEPFEIIARGLNCESEAVGTSYSPNDSRWDSSGGGEMTITYHENGSAVLNTASIQSGAGLGVDSLFTGIIKNFMKRFGPRTQISRASKS
jgi:N,N-dimethylformamidase